MIEINAGPSYSTLLETVLYKITSDIGVPIIFGLGNEYTSLTPENLDYHISFGKTVISGGSDVRWERTDAGYAIIYPTDSFKVLKVRNEL